MDRVTPSTAGEDGFDLERVEAEQIAAQLRTTRHRPVGAVPVWHEFCDEAGPMMVMGLGTGVPDCKG